MRVANDVATSDTGEGSRSWLASLPGERVVSMSNDVATPDLAEAQESDRFALFFHGSGRLLSKKKIFNHPVCQVTWPNVFEIIRLSPRKAAAGQSE